MAEKKQNGAAALAKKGDGVLTRVGSVWTYPGCAIDPSGTNLRLPLEYVSDAEVKELLQAGDLVGVTQSVGGELLSVRLKGDDGAVVLTTAQAGTAEAGTELPPGSRPTHDAGASVAASAADIASEVERSFAAATGAAPATSDPADAAPAGQSKPKPAA
ncbi:hypothetical protein [Chelatococcus reniformis]|uniref:Uncharacterized protein n=1 Tax=Chelatococcus reniformis TaxID=1494448 RepID=A0A916UEI5_9HYPH|nr:hypothetical protein [Chelatococcus reniformis]GGC70724.1 hypothetical protein GCM10010994_31600 [Chelatococcus reniformis]